MPVWNRKDLVELRKFDGFFLLGIAAGCLTFSIELRLSQHMKTEQEQCVSSSKIHKLFTHLVRDHRLAKNALRLYLSPGEKTKGKCGCESIVDFHDGIKNFILILN